LLKLLKDGKRFLRRTFSTRKEKKRCKKTADPLLTFCVKTKAFCPRLKTSAFFSVEKKIMWKDQPRPRKKITKMVKRRFFKKADEMGVFLFMQKTDKNRR